MSVGLNLYSQKAFVVKNARELLFEGYQDDLIDMARELARFDPETFAIPYDRFGWFYDVSATVHLYLDGTYSNFCGFKNAAKWKR